MSARIAHIYAPSHRAVCASMSNENELVTSLAQNRTDDLDAPFAKRTKRHSAAKHKQRLAMER